MPTPHHKPLGDGLVLRTAADECDAERVAAFNGEVHGKLALSMTRNLFLHHPNTHIEDLIFVEDTQSDKIVSSLCLIPWTWCYENVEIPTGEMGIVGTLEGYRGRGLIRAQVELFKQRLRERGCLLSQIQGIPYYYRQFGYEYAIPLERWLMLETRHIPEQPEPTFTFRSATVEDIPTLMQLYDEAAQDLTIHAARDEAIWRYLLTHAAGTETERDTWIVEDAGGQTAGYVCAPHHHFGEELAVSEGSRLSFDAALAALSHTKRLTVEQKRPGIRLNLPIDCTLAQVARSLDARDGGAYAWQIHVPDMVALLRAIAPVLERRIAASPLAGLTRDVRICLYRETILLRFETGRLTEVTNAGFTTWHQEPIRLPPLQLIPLVLGHRTWQELHDTHPDVDVEPKSRVLVDTLFPKMTSFIYTIY
jgi:GNAT superfamily N-acetyltransferase